MTKRHKAIWATAGTPLSTILIVCGLFCSLPTVIHAQIMNIKQADQVAEQLYSTQTVTLPALAHPGDFDVGVQTIEIDGPNLLNKPVGRKLTLEVWYPAQNVSGPAANYENVTRSKRAFAIKGLAYRDAKVASVDHMFPLVVLSHGYTGYRTIMFYLGEHLASHGYTVVGIDHTDSTNLEIDFENNGGAGFPSTLLHRSRDQQAVLDYFSKDGARFGANTNQSSVIGFSMGGYGALNTVGANYQFSAEQALAFGLDGKSNTLSALNDSYAGLEVVDPRWKALVTLAPWGGEQNVFGSMSRIKVPSLFIAGEQDDVSGYKNGVEKLYKQTGAKDKYLMVYESARHNVAPHPAPSAAFDSELAYGHYAEPSWNTETLNRINQHMILAFLDCHIKNQHCEMLPMRVDATQSKDKKGALNAPWPGFVNRFATGIRFYRR